MKILIFSLSYHPMTAGAEVAIDEITKRNPEIEFDVVTLRFDKSHPNFERIGNVNVYRIGGGLGYLSKILFVPQAANFAIKRKYDLYWGIMTYMLFPLALIRIGKIETPYILTLQDGDPFSQVFNRFYILPFKPLLLYGFRHAHKIQVISTFLAEWPRLFGFEGTVEVIPNGVETKRFENPAPKMLNSDLVTLITVSRLVPKNGVENIIEALTFLPASTKLKILGVGPLEKPLKEKVKALGVGSRVEFLGFISQKDLPQHLFAADIFVRPSLSEGQGISFIEAMAAGIPVIATPVGGIPDFLKDRETGLFCNVNDPKSIAEKVMEYVSDPELRERVVKNAKEMVVQKYDWDLIAAEMKSKVFNTL